VATKALSPAINDPTTAVQVLDYIEAFLEVLARAELRERYLLGGRDGALRVVMPGRSWADYLQLAVTEIREYGMSSTQVCRRLRALLDTVLEVAPPDRRAPVRTELGRLAAAVDATFPDPRVRELVSAGDRQGLGGRVGLSTVKAGVPLGRTAYDAVPVRDRHDGRQPD
jgi:uncharacterized membrane protein